MGELAYIRFQENFEDVNQIPKSSGGSLKRAFFVVVNGSESSYLDSRLVNHRGRRSELKKMVIHKSVSRISRKNPVYCYLQNRNTNWPSCSAYNKTRLFDD